VQMWNLGEGRGGEPGMWLLFAAGVAGAGAMILPGVSGGYLLLVLGAYVPILDAIDQARRAAQQGDLTALWQPFSGVILPVGLGVLIGVALIGNALKWVLDRWPRPTLGVLMGLLLGAVVGLWPFQQGVEPLVGSMLKGQTVVISDDGRLVFEATGKAVGPKDYPRQLFRPTAAQGGGAVVLIIVGFAITAAVGRIGQRGQSQRITESGAST
jgi:putative membrane protein